MRQAWAAQDQEVNLDAIHKRIDRDSKVRFNRAVYPEGEYVRVWCGGGKCDHEPREYVGTAGRGEFAADHPGLVDEDKG